METLTFVKRDSTDKEGNPLVTKDGRPYVRMSIKVASRGDRYLSGFGNAANGGWQVGDEVDIVITESDKLDKNGKPYLNFSLPKPEDKANEALNKILMEITPIKLMLQEILSHVKPRKKSPQEVDEDINIDDVPF